MAGTKHSGAKMTNRDGPNRGKVDQLVRASTSIITTKPLIASLHHDSADTTLIVVGGVSNTITQRTIRSPSDTSTPESGIPNTTSFLAPSTPKQQCIHGLGEGCHCCLTLSGTLPTELRCKIRKKGFEPRRIRLDILVPKKRDTNQKWRHVCNAGPPPIALSVNVESRIEALRVYNLSFPLEWKALARDPEASQDPNNHLKKIWTKRNLDGDSHGNQEARIYFSLDFDTVSISSLQRNHNYSQSLLRDYGTWPNITLDIEYN